MIYTVKDAGPSVKTMLLFLAGTLMFLVELMISSGLWFFFSIIGLLFMLGGLFYYLKATTGSKVPAEIITDADSLSIASRNGQERIRYASMVRITCSPSPDGKEAWVTINYDRRKAKTMKMERKMADAIVAEISPKIPKWA